ncbi:MAG: EthD domain-containing protein [Hyphomonadaceae bacterium]|nr:EthD domain-containing protein [Hyphomonadaceae bacterium]
MQKVMFAFWADAGSQEALNAALLGPVKDDLLAAGAARLRVNVPDEAVADGQKLYPEMAADRPAALVSFFVNTARRLEPFEAALRKANARYAGFEVMESTPLPHRTPADGERSPGFTQLAFFKRLPDQRREDFLTIWLESHTKVAIDTQSTFFYQQNPILRPLTKGAPDWDAIVEESFPAEAMFDWNVYFDAVGSDEKLAAHRAQMSESCARFIDFTGIKLLISSEYRFGDWRDL